MTELGTLPVVQSIFMCARTRQQKLDGQLPCLAQSANEKEECTMLNVLTDEMGQLNETELGPQGLWHSQRLMLSTVAKSLWLWEAGNKSSTGHILAGMGFF